METILRQRLKDGSFSNVPAARSRVMSAVKGKGNKSTELRLRMALVRHGLVGWEMHPAGLAGNPDFIFQKHKLALFVDGCFWHGCTECGHVPRTNNAFWKAKIMRNRERDQRTTEVLRESGMKVVRVWEHSLKSPKNLTRIVARVRKWTKVLK